MVHARTILPSKSTRHRTGSVLARVGTGWTLIARAGSSAQPVGPSIGRERHLQAIRPRCFVSAMSLVEALKYFREHRLF